MISKRCKWIRNSLFERYHQEQINNVRSVCHIGVFHFPEKETKKKKRKKTKLIDTVSSEIR